MSDLAKQRDQIDHATYADEMTVVNELVNQAGLSQADRTRIKTSATNLVTQIRNASDPGLMEVFLAEYGLSTDEGIALMCLAEALLRVPDAETQSPRRRKAGPDGRITRRDEAFGRTRHPQCCRSRNA